MRQAARLRQFFTPELIALNKVLELVHKGRSPLLSLPQRQGDRIDKFIRRRDDAVTQALDGVTLRSLITEGNNGADQSCGSA